ASAQHYQRPLQQQRAVEARRHQIEDEVRGHSPRGEHHLGGGLGGEEEEDDGEQPQGASKLKNMARKGKEWLKGLGKGGKGKEKERRNLPEISPSVESLVGEAELGEARAVTVTPVTAPSKPTLVSPQQVAAPAIYQGGEGTSARAPGKRTARARLEGYE
ncbi:MAG: hypothetical protein Q9183_003918, partial [Haloplaca sp. 2 TL-2023]